MNGRKCDGPTENSSFRRKRIINKKIPCTSGRTPTSDKNDDSNSEPVDDRRKVKRRANWERDIAEKKRRLLTKLSDSSDDELPTQSPRRYPHSNPQIVPGGSVQNPLSSDSEISPNSQLQDYEELTFTYPPFITTTTDTSAPSNDLISFGNLEQHFQVIHESEDQPNSTTNSDGSSKHSYVFRNLLYTSNNNETEEISCEQRIFQPNSASEGQDILRDIRNDFESENKLKDSTSQTETLSIQQTVKIYVFQNPSDKDNQDCYDWDKFLERWEGMHIVSESTSKVQPPEYGTTEEPEDILQPGKRKMKETARTSSQFFPFNGQAKKRVRIADDSTEEKGIIVEPVSMNVSETDIASKLQNTHITDDSTEQFIIVEPVSMNVSETDIASKLQNTTINLLESRQMPPFLKKFILLESVPNKTNGSYDAFHQDDSSNLRKENITGGTNNSDKIEELTCVEGDDTEMVS